MTRRGLYTFMSCRDHIKNLPNWSIMIAIALLFAGNISCSKKFPVATTNNAGILVIPLEIIDDNPNHKFLHNYVINYTPETDAEIVVIPSTSKQYEIIDNFPVGTYSPLNITSIGLTLKGIGSAGTRRKDVLIAVQNRTASLKDGLILLGFKD